MRSSMDFVLARKVGALSLVVVLLLAFSVIVQAGSTTDWGQLTGTPTPATCNYVAWLGTAVTSPSEILTEDGYQFSTGVDKGFQSSYWYLNTSNFANPAAATGNNVSMVFGGVGASVGSIWAYSFTLNRDVASTPHGIVGTQASGTCPTMLPGSQGTNGRTINWSGNGAAQYLVYRSKLASGFGNGASNGRYQFVAAVSGATTSYLDMGCPIGTNCWHVVIPADGSGLPNGCHSEESTPTAVTLSTFRAADPAVNWPLIAGLGALAAVVLGGLAVTRRRAAGR